jgi:hypothetical protein
MKRYPTFILLLALWTLSFSVTFGQQDDFALKICGSYYVKCARTIVFGEHSILNIVGDDLRGRKVSFDIYSPNGILEATLQDGRFSGPGEINFTVHLFDEGFDVLDIRDRRVILRIIRQDNPSQSRVDLLVWADLYLPDGNRFQCSPEDCNVPMLSMMKGVTFSNVNTAIQLR